MRHRFVRRAAALSAALFASALIHSAAAAEGEPSTVIDAEYAFAASAQPLGVRGAFLKYLSNDAIICSPAPVNGIASTAAGKPNKDSLEWYPTYSQTAASADLGYTTGPWTYRSADGKGEAHGTFLSVWRKQPDGSWRVALDCGISHPKFDAPPQGLKASATGTTTGAAAADAESTGNWKDPVAAAESRFTTAAAPMSTAATTTTALPRPMWQSPATR